MLAILSNPGWSVESIIAAMKELPPEEQDKILTKIVNVVTGDRAPTKFAGAPTTPEAPAELQPPAQKQAEVDQQQDRAQTNVTEVLSNREEIEREAREEREAIVQADEKEVVEKTDEPRKTESKGKIEVIQGAAQTARDAHPPDPTDPQLNFVQEPGQHLRPDPNASEVSDNGDKKPFVRQTQDLSEAHASVLADLGFGTEHAGPPTTSPADAPQDPKPISLENVPAEIVSAKSLRDVFQWLWNGGYTDKDSLVQHTYSLRDKIPLVSRTAHSKLGDRVDRWLYMRQG